MKKDFQDLFQEVKVAGKRSQGGEAAPLLGRVWQGVKVARMGREAAKVRAGREKSQMFGDFEEPEDDNDSVEPIYEGPK